MHVFCADICAKKKLFVKTVFCQFEVQGLAKARPYCPQGAALGYSNIIVSSRLEKQNQDLVTHMGLAIAHTQG